MKKAVGQRAIQLNNKLHSAKGPSEVGDLLREASRRFATVVTSRPLAIVASNSCDLVGAAAWMAFTQNDGMILPKSRLSAEMEGRLLAEGFCVFDLDSEKSSPLPPQKIPVESGRVSLLTSGTTGEPKIISHKWDTLFTMSRVRSEQKENWLLTYQAGTYAWWQMITLLLFLPGKEVTASEDGSPLSLFNTAIKHDVTSISSTPTFWRMLMLHVPRGKLEELRLNRITLGGEAVDQSILDWLKSLFPRSVITHIYASSEAGAAIVVNDGIEGFPASWLESPQTSTSGSPQIQIRNNVLWIRSPFATKAGWICSGDLCELRSGRVVVTGREQEAFINVGGAKVPAHEVERILSLHQDVLWCRVKPTKAPFVGELVAADLVLREGRASICESDIIKFCSGKMPEHMVPRVINVLSQIPVSDNLKAKLK